jgi:hypothetical protein
MFQSVWIVLREFLNIIKSYIKKNIDGLLNALNFVLKMSPDIIKLVCSSVEVVQKIRTKLYVLVANTDRIGYQNTNLTSSWHEPLYRSTKPQPPHRMDQFYTLLQTSFVTSAGTLGTCRGYGKLCVKSVILAWDHLLIYFVNYEKDILSWGRHANLISTSCSF